MTACILHQRCRSHSADKTLAEKALLGVSDMPLVSSNGSISKSEDDRSSVVAPQLNLPKRGEAMRGMGEKFAANPVTGTGSTTIPIYASPGRSGFGPEVSLSYYSGRGNSPFGFGRCLALTEIARKTDKGLPQYKGEEESNIFILSGAEDLMPQLVQSGIPEGSHPKSRTKTQLPTNSWDRLFN